MIVQKGNLFLVTDRRDLYRNWKPVFSNSPFDAKDFKRDEDARAKAKKIGGVVRLFDAVNGNFI